VVCAGVLTFRKAAGYQKDIGDALTGVIMNQKSTSTPKKLETISQRETGNKDKKRLS
jgi:hypothetical protein